MRNETSPLYWTTNHLFPRLAGHGIPEGGWRLGPLLIEMHIIQLLSLLFGTTSFFRLRAIVQEHDTAYFMRKPCVLVCGVLIYRNPNRVIIIKYLHIHTCLFHLIRLVLMHEIRFLCPSIG